MSDGRGAVGGDWGRRSMKHRVVLGMEFRWLLLILGAC